MAKKKEKIVRVKFNETQVMMFGDSYKPWTLQLDEYLWLLKRNGELEGFEEVMISDDSWIDWGGLKWCPEGKFQHQLNREGCQESEPDNPTPRQYKEMTFYRDSFVSSQVKKIFENLHANIY